MGKMTMIGKRRKIEINNTKILNLGCGNNPMENATNVDIVPTPFIQICHDLNIYPYPFTENSFREVHAYFILEHLKDTIPFVNEAYRILENDGLLIIKVPYDISYSAWACPQHYRAFNLHSFNIFVNDSYKNICTSNYNLSFRFKSLKKKLWFPKGWHIYNYPIEFFFNFIPRIYEETFLRFLFPAHSIIITLKK